MGAPRALYGLSIAENTRNIIGHYSRLIFPHKPPIDFCMTQDVDPKLLEILVCPLTKVPLRYDREKQELISDRARLAYPIHDGIPIMLVDEARQLEDREVKK